MALSSDSIGTRVAHGGELLRRRRADALGRRARRCAAPDSAPRARPGGGRAGRTRRPRPSARRGRSSAALCSSISRRRRSTSRTTARLGAGLGSRHGDFLAWRRGDGNAIHRERVARALGIAHHDSALRMTISDRLPAASVAHMAHFSASPRLSGESRSGTAAVDGEASGASLRLTTSATATYTRCGLGGLGRPARRLCGGVRGTTTRHRRCTAAALGGGVDRVRQHALPAALRQGARAVSRAALGRGAPPARRAVRRPTRTTPWSRTIAACQRSSRRSPIEAIKDIEHALSLRPDLQPAVLDLGILYFETGQYDAGARMAAARLQRPANRFLGRVLSRPHQAAPRRPERRAAAARRGGEGSGAAADRRNTTRASRRCVRAMRGRRSELFDAGAGRAGRTPRRHRSRSQ